MPGNDFKRRIHLFDFDGTLIKRDSFGDFPIFAFGRCRFYAVMLRSLPDLIRWKLGKISNAEAKERIFARLYGGKKLSDLTDILSDYAGHIPLILNHKVSDLFFKNLMDGEEVYIISASPEMWIKPWVDELVEQNREYRLHLLATLPEVDKEGRLTGKFASPNCHGPEKPRRFMEALRHEAETSGKEAPVRDDLYIVAYGDSAGDREMFEFADEYYKY